MRGKYLSTFALFFLISLQCTTIVAQGNSEDKPRAISTAVPFLTISPESRGGGMGDAGVASSPDMNSQYLNPAKYAFIEGDMGASVSFTPWLRKLVNDINMFYGAYYIRLDKMQTVSASIRYFDLGDIAYTNLEGGVINNGKPNEFAIDAAYSRVLSDKVSGAVAFRYIRSDLTNGYTGNDYNDPGSAFAADIAFYYKTRTKIGKKKSDISAGVNISNIGSKISYDGGINKQFLPTNLKIGAGYATEIDRYNSIAFVLDFNKLLVPTPQILEEGEEDPNKDISVMSGIFKSFGDAPGGFQEELQEINVSVGAEYWYNKQFAMRAGYYHQHENKGNRKYATAGLGLKFTMFTLDASYIIPVVQGNALANTMRFSLSFDLDELRK
ncbi:MAG: type IX secretion system outer membrane channel protein PorV [Marinilabiliaceae bacterium]|nr:type IX secretion system outer membrane channel protein PorV [Marinilabiliaceae bacterium]